eukprot:10867649-Karenia_brevis.AAC.1
MVSCSLLRTRALALACLEMPQLRSGALQGSCPHWTETYASLQQVPSIELVFGGLGSSKQKLVA